MKEILMLWPDINEEWPAMINKKNSIVEAATLYKPVGKYQRGLRKLFSRLNLPTSKFFESWTKEFNNYKMIILHANEINRTVPIWLRKNEYKGRIIYWYWNPVQNCISPKKIDKSKCELWSFDPLDCINYNLNFNTTYYIKEFCKNSMELKYDVFFIGQDKGRILYLNKLEASLNKLGITTLFWIVKDQTSNIDYPFREKLSYEKSLTYVAQSKAIIDYVQEGQSGQTLRAMEALFFKKKLITNNIAIKECDFYLCQNIFILGEDNLEEINTFLETPFYDPDEIIVNSYQFDNWILNFGEW